MNGMRGVMAALATSMAVSAFATGPDVRGLTEWTTPTLTIYAQDGAKARAVIRCFSFGERMLYTLLNREPRPDGIPTYVVMPRGSVWKKYLQPGDALDSEFVPTRFANYILISNWMKDRELNWRAYHEHAHAFLRAQFAGHLPLWFDDGLASIVANWSSQAGVVRIGEKTWPTTNLPMPTSRLLRIGRHSPEYRGRKSAGFHFQSKIFVHKILFGDEEFRRQSYAYLSALNAGMEIDEAVQHAFGYGVDQLHETLTDYSNQFYVNVADFRIEWQEPPLPEHGRELGEFEGLELIARVMLETGFNPMRLEEVISAATRLQPDSPRTLVLWLRLAVRNQDDTMIESFWNRLQPLVKDPQVARWVGLALFERLHEPAPGNALSDEARTRFSNRAFDLLSASEHALALDAEAAWALGHIAVSLDREMSFALQRVELARQSMPRNAELSEVSARLLGKLGRRDDMIAQLRNTLRNARTVPQILWAKEQLAAAAISPGEKQ